MPDGPVPVFGLYGEGAGLTVPGFVHAERIPSRASLHDWRIGTHRHPDLSQALLVTAGGGRLEIDTEERGFEAPWLLWIPSGVVHGFDFRPGTDGFVVSAADEFLAALLRRDPEERLLQAAAERVTNEAMGTIEEIDLDLPPVFATLERETASALPGSLSAVGALLKLILVGVARTAAVRAIAAPGLAARSSLYRRFRALAERQYRSHWPVARYAAALGVTADRLHAVCTETAGRSPKAILQDRLLLEAKRSLLHTTMTVAEVAFDLGFEDAAYFSRFFARRAGMTAIAYRNGDVR